MLIDAIQIYLIFQSLLSANGHHRLLHIAILSLVAIDFGSALYAAFTTIAVSAGYLPETVALHVFWSQFISGRAFDAQLLAITAYAAFRIYARTDRGRWQKIIENADKNEKRTRTAIATMRRKFKFQKK